MASAALFTSTLICLWAAASCSSVRAPPKARLAPAMAKGRARGARPARRARRPSFDVGGLSNGLGLSSDIRVRTRRAWRPRRQTSRARRVADLGDRPARDHVADALLLPLAQLSLGVNAQAPVLHHAAEGALEDRRIAQDFREIVEQR